jgi:hypothetical protein
METENRKIPILDIYQAAFLVHNEIEPVLCKQGSRVVFEFPGTELVFELLDEYNRNPSIRLLDFVGRLRRLRAQMLSMRG